MSELHSGCTAWRIWRQRAHTLTDTAYLRFSSSSAAVAVARYQREERKLRQGGIFLVDPNGNLIYRFTAPALRTRW